MYVFLLALGAIITASGIALVASGVSINEHAFDAAAITPGAVAVIGGLILVGLGLAVRVLQRIERALAARPAAQADRPVEIAAPALQQRPNVPAPVATAATAAANTQPLVVATAEAVEPVQEPAPDPTLEQFRETFSTVVRFGSSPVVPDNDVSSPRPPVRVSEAPAEAANGYASGVANGSAPVRIAPQQRAEEKPRQVAAQPRHNASVFESLWPKAARSGRQAQAAAAPLPMPQAAEPEQSAAARLEVVPVSAPQLAPVPVSVLKSGVVDGMAYTLYSDGSIEAQLPQGTLRFGSITELRNHIEQEEQ